MIKHFVKILELLGDRLEVCVSVCFGWEKKNNFQLHTLVWSPGQEVIKKNFHAQLSCARNLSCL